MELITVLYFYWGGGVVAKKNNIRLQGGGPIMITIDYIGRGGVQKNPKSDYVILEQPLTHIAK